MKSFWKLIFYPIWAIAFTLFLTPSLKAEELQTVEIEVEQKTDVYPIPIADIPRIGDLESVHTTIAPLLAQESAQAVIQITGVKINPTATGVEIVLETTTGSITAPGSKTQGEILYFDIPKATLSLGDSQEFRVENPAKGITNISVTQASPTYVRVQITGAEGVPSAEVATNERGLVITPGPSTAPVAEAPEEDEVEITVTGEQQRGYRVPNTSTATKTDTPIRDIPQSIQVIPRQILEDRNVIRTGEALQNVSGVINQEGGFNGIDDQIVIRGFVATTFSGSYFRDGVPYFSRGFTETANLESIEVLKGPASVLFGQGQPGGIINLVTKQPLREPYYSVSATIGSFNSYRSLLDFSGPLNEDKSLRYRLNVSYENSRSFRDFVRSERFFISPVIVWDISPNTSLKIDGDFITSNNTMVEELLMFLPVVF
jgi:iron complex outermembrane recepter protein